MAAGKFKIEWHGKELLRELRAISDEQTKDAAKRIERRLHKYVPVRQKPYPPSKVGGKGYLARSRGNLKRSIRIAKSKFRGGGHIALVGHAGAYYAYWVERGTVYTFRQKYGRKGDKYMKRAADAEKRMFVYHFKKAVGGV